MLSYVTLYNMLYCVISRYFILRYITRYVYVMFCCITCHVMLRYLLCYITLLLFYITCYVVLSLCYVI